MYYNQLNVLKRTEVIGWPLRTAAMSLLMAGHVGREAGLPGPRAASPAELNRIEPESNRLRIE